MKLTKQQVLDIAKLARLQVTEAEIEQYQKDLSAILSFVEDMSSADVGQINEMAHPQEVAQRLREDKVTEPNERDKFQALAPAVQDGLYLVPKVIE